MKKDKRTKAQLIQEIHELKSEILSLESDIITIKRSYEEDDVCRKHTKREKKLSDENTKLYRLTNLLMDSQAFILRNTKN